MTAGTRPGPDAPPLFWIDLLRVAGAVAVVFLHVAAQPVVFLKDHGSPAWWIGNLIDSAARWCVPIFVMLSGALLLPPRDEPTRAFFARRVRRIALPLAAWTVAYIAFRAAQKGMPSWAWIGQKILYGRPEYHMWYVYMTLGLYLLTPLLRRFTAWADRAWLVGASAVAFLTAAVHQALYRFGYTPMFESVFTMYVPFLGYYLAGYTLLRHRPAVPTAVLVATVALCIAATALGTWALMERYSPHGAGLYLYQYLAPTVIAMSLSIFLLGARVAGPPPGGLLARWVRDASAATLGIYLVHPMFIQLLRTQGLRPIALGADGVPIVAMTALLLSYASVSLLRRTPLLRHTV